MIIGPPLPPFRAGHRRRYASTIHEADPKELAFLNKVIAAELVLLAALAIFALVTLLRFLGDA